MPNDYEKLKHIQDSYIESFDFLQERKQRQVRQLILLNNLQRGDQNIASTLLLTLFNRLLSSLYDDKLQVKFLPSQGITQNQINSYNTLYQSDYLEMGKAKLDYDWVWDTLFFGRGYMETKRFNKRRKIMEPHVINPLVFGYDPYFEEVQDWRYYWKWVLKSETEIERLIKNGTIKGIKKAEDIASGVDEYLWDYKQQRDAAKKAVEPPTDSANKHVYQILEFCGQFEGEKYCFWIDKNFSKVVYEEKLEFEDLDYGDQDEKGSKWPIVVKEAMREPHSSVVFSIADLLEDKHRAKSVLLNLAFIAAKDKANPTYLYNPDLIKDITQFFSRQIDQHIPVEDIEKAVAPLNTENPMDPGLIQFISMLQQEANEPIGTGISLSTDSHERTATAKAIDQQLNDMAQSLISKVLQFGESEFCSHWFHRYAKHSEELGEKMANIVGVKGITTEIVDLKDFNTDYPPGVLVYSAKEAEYKELVLRRDLMELYSALVGTLDPDGLRNFNKHVFFPKFLNDPSLIDVMLPETLDEMNAKTENERLVKNDMMDAAPTDNHTTHIYTHMTIPPGERSWAMWFHIEQHKQLLAQQKAMEMQAMQMQMMAGGGAGQSPGQPNSINMGAEKKSPMAAASPMKTEFNPAINQPSNQTK